MIKDRMFYCLWEFVFGLLNQFITIISNQIQKHVDWKIFLHISFYITWENMEKRVPCVWINRRPNRLTLTPKLIGNGTKKESSWLAKPDCNFWTILSPLDNNYHKSRCVFFHIFLSVFEQLQKKTLFEFIITNIKMKYQFWRDPHSCSLK